MPKKTNELWLTKRLNGTYMLTSQMPLLKAGVVTKQMEYWPQPGDEIIVDHICPLGALLMFGVKLDPLVPVLVTITAGVAGNEASKHVASMDGT